MIDAYFAALVLVNVVFATMALANIAYFRMATRRARIRRGPFVSVIVPARDEESSIGACLESLLAQDYDGFEVVVVDDESSDRTGAIVASMSGRDPRLRLVRGEPLPEGWLGKPHALAQGVAAARGDVLIFTDADTRHTPDSISFSVTNLEDHRAAMLSGYLEQMYGSFGERVIVPTMYTAMMLVPFFLLPLTTGPRVAFAIGQYVAVRREALDAVGGFESIRDSIVDDMSLASRVKDAGFRGVFLDARSAARCRLYRGYRNAFTGIERSIYSGVGANPLVALAMNAIVLGLIVGPALATLAAGLRLQAPAWPIGVAFALFVVAWALVSWDRDVPLVSFVVYPLVFANLIAILDVSTLKTGFGSGADWKGRKVRVPRAPGTLRAALAAIANRFGRGR